MEEMRQSCRIIQQALGRLPEGEVRAKVPKYIKPPAGEVYHVVESPRGEQGFHIVATGGEWPVVMRFRTPSLAPPAAALATTKGAGAWRIVARSRTIVNCRRVVDAGA